MTSKSTDLVIAKFDYKATDSHELGIQKGERLTLLDDTQHWWRVMNAQGTTGYVPSNYVKKSKQGIFSSLRNTLGRRKSRQEGSASARPSKPSSPVPDNNGTSGPAEKNSSVESLEQKFSRLNSPAGIIPSSGLATGDIQTTADSTVNQCNIPPATTQADEILHRPSQGFSSAYGRNRSLDNVVSDIPGFGRQIGGAQPNISGTEGGLSGNFRQNGHAEPTNPLLGLQGQSLGPQSQLGNVENNSYFGTGSGLGRHICQALFAYPASQPDELSIERGDQIRVLEKSSDGWWRGVLVTEGRPALMGWFPSNYVTTDMSKILNRSGSSSQPNNLNASLSRTGNESHVYHTTMSMQAQLQAQLLAQQYQAAKSNQQPKLTSAASVQPVGDMSRPYRPRETVITLYPFARNQVEEMSFDADEVLEVLDKPADDPDWWRCRNERGESGLVPRNYVRVLTALPSVSSQSTSQPTVVTNTTTVSAANHRGLGTTAPFEEQRRKRGTDQRVDGAVAQSVGAGGGSGAAVGQRTDGETLRLTYALRSTTARSHAHQPWCWGAISRAECEAMLSRYSRPGEFVIRDSESHPGDLTVTINAGNKTRNFKVYVERDSYHIGQKVFGSIEELIEHYRTHPIFKNEQEKHYLTRPFIHPGVSDPSRPITSAVGSITSPSSSFLPPGGSVCPVIGGGSGMQSRFS